MWVVDQITRYHQFVMANVPMIFLLSAYGNDGIIVKCTIKIFLFHGVKKIPCVFEKIMNSGQIDNTPTVSYFSLGG